MHDQVVLRLPTFRALHELGTSETMRPWIGRLLAMHPDAAICEQSVQLSVCR